MPNSAQEQAARRDTLRKLLRRTPAGTQQSLVDALRKRGLVATQSSVSRDLREIGAVKTVRGYELPATGEVRDDEFASVAEFLRDVTPAGPNAGRIAPIHGRIGPSAGPRIGSVLVSHPRTR